MRYRVSGSSLISPLTSATFASSIDPLPNLVLGGDDVLEAPPSRLFDRTKIGIHCTPECVKPVLNHYCRAEATHCAQASVARSSPCRPTIWMPSGNPAGPVPAGTVTHG